MLEQIRNALPETYPVFIGDIPDSPDDVCVLFVTGGRNPDRELGEALPFLWNPTFQVRVRNKRSVAATEYLEKIKTILNGYSCKNSLMVIQQGDILSMGKDSKGRIEFTLNFAIQSI